MPGVRCPVSVVRCEVSGARCEVWQREVSMIHIPSFPAFVKINLQTILLQTTTGSTDIQA